MCKALLNQAVSFGYEASKRHVSEEGLCFFRFCGLNFALTLRAEKFKKENELQEAVRTIARVLAVFRWLNEETNRHLTFTTNSSKSAQSS